MVLIVDDRPDNLAVLRDALEESGYTVVLAGNGELALQHARTLQPDLLLLDTAIPGLDAFALARRLKSETATAGIPIVFMTGSGDTEQAVRAFDAGGVDVLHKPVRTREVLARVATHLHGARVQRQARNALDAFGHATLAVREHDGRCVWQTALARSLMAEFFAAAPGLYDDTRLPPEVFAWLHRELLRRRAGAEPAGLTVARGARRLAFALHAVDGEALGEGQWLLVMRVASDEARVDALQHAFRLTAREAEVLYWVVKGKTNRDIGEILGTSPRTVHKHLEHVFQKLGVETRTAAAAMALQRVSGMQG